LASMARAEAEAAAARASTYSSERAFQQLVAIFPNADPGWVRTQLSAAAEDGSGDIVGQVSARMIDGYPRIGERLAAAAGGGGDTRAPPHEAVLEMGEWLCAAIIS
jgi:hypothetical protein